jgi:hypothetical protein
MSIYRFIVIFLGSLFIVQHSYSQSPEIKAYQDSIRLYLGKVKADDDDSAKILNALHISKLFKEVLSIPESFGYGFDSLKTVGKLVAPDQSFRIVTWNFPLTNGTYKYSGIIQHKNEKGLMQLFELSDRVDEIDNAENIVLSARRWYGALYYRVLINKVDNYTYYTLLGLRYNDLFTTTKLIDVLYFDQFDNPVFGAPLFKIDKSVKHRIIFQFSARVAMNLTYNEKLKMIVFDHLSPSESKFTGLYLYYGPDFSYDGFTFKDRKWLYTPNLDLKRSEPTQKRPSGKSDKLR